MKKPRILVTSAAGRTGSEAVRLLRDAGYPVRAFVRRQDARSKSLEQMGAEIFVGNLFDFRDLVAAMKDVQRAYHCPPFAPNLLHNTMLFCLAAQEARLEAMVLLSGWNPSPIHPSAITREHWIANNIARWMPDVDVVHVNPGIFAFTYLLTLPVTKQLGLLPLPYGTGPNAPVAARDIARMVTSILQNPEGHAGKSWRPTGPALLDPSEAADIMGRVLGRRVRHLNVSIKMFAKAAKAQGFPVFDTFNMRHYAEEIAEGAFAIAAPTDHLEQVTGNPGESFEETVRRYNANPSLIATGMSHVSFFGALGFMSKMMATRAPKFDAFEAAGHFPTIAQSKLGNKNPDWIADAKAKRIMLLAPNDTVKKELLRDVT